MMIITMIVQYLCICIVFIGRFMIRSLGRRWMKTRRTQGDIEWVWIVYKSNTSYLKKSNLWRSEVNVENNYCD